VYVLHAWIRFFECVLHLSYKMPLWKRQVCVEKHKQIVAHRKHIEDTFKHDIGLLVD